MRRYGPSDVLGLAAVSVRGNYHAPGDFIGSRGTEVLANQLEAQVDGGGRASGSENAPVFHVKHRGIEGDGGKAGREVLDMHPVGRCPAMVEEACVGQDEGARANTHDPTVPQVGFMKGVQELDRGLGVDVLGPMMTRVSACARSRIVPAWSATNPLATLAAGVVGQTWKSYQGS